MGGPGRPDKSHILATTPDGANPLRVSSSLANTESSGGVRPSRNWFAAASDAASVARLRWPILLNNMPASTISPMNAAKPTKASAIKTIA